MNELFKNNIYRILEQFIGFPNKDFSARGIARDLSISHATVLKHIHELEKINLIKKKEETLYPTYFANSQDIKYKFYKKNFLIFKLMDSGIVDYIQKETLPNSIILFGSGAKATFTEKSDIDIFVEAKGLQLNLKKYEQKLKYKINLLFETNVNNLSKELTNNIINGVVLYGFVKVRDKNG